MRTPTPGQLSAWARLRADMTAHSNLHRDAKALQWARAVQAARSDDEMDVATLRARFGCSKQWAQRVLAEARGER